MISLLNLPVVEIESVATGKACMSPGEGQQLSYQACYRSFAIAAGNPYNGNTSILIARKEMIDNSFTNRAGPAGGRLDMHQQTGAGVDFDDGAPLFSERSRDVGGDKIDACNIQPDYTRG